VLDVESFLSLSADVCLSSRALDFGRVADVSRRVLPAVLRPAVARSAGQQSKTLLPLPLSEVGARNVSDSDAAVTPTARSDGDPSRTRAAFGFLRHRELPDLGLCCVSGAAVVADATMVESRSTGVRFPKGGQLAFSRKPLLGDGFDGSAASEDSSRRHRGEHPLDDFFPCAARLCRSLSQLSLVARLLRRLSGTSCPVDDGTPSVAARCLAASSPAGCGRSTAAPRSPPSLPDTSERSGTSADAADLSVDVTGDDRGASRVDDKRVA